MKAHMGIPAGQRNAEVGGELVMRVGIPHKGGKLAFHAFNEGFPAMVSANAFWNPAAGGFQFPRATDVSELDFAMDSAGYTAMKMWQSKGQQRGMAGIFPWTYSQYIEFATQSGASWWSQPDLCCEPEIAHNQEEIDFRINATATLLEGVLRILYEWQNELARTCSSAVVAHMLKPPVPVLQGWSAGDYRRSLELLNAVWERWQPWLATPALIGVGSVCRRTLKHPTHGLFSVLSALEGNLPTGSRLHLFGVKGACLAELKMLDWVASADSMAYDYGARVKAHQTGISNSIAHRSTEMSRWMSTASDLVRPAAGDQFRLNLFG
ncbi:DUF7221 family queuine tRNA-ribosyltransferase-like protein [Cupriavidus basilensis]|uniref:deazapurine DNA modification protein DpdA family protein n=1 Tax=Cupriavidus basilensis TaxID=68895 RepID=UPI0005BCC3B5|nr:hypothetical protein [Cupriavidus basilensis]